MYTKVVLGLPVEGPFDYLVSQKDYKKIKLGARVKINFRGQKKLGYVAGLSKKTKIKNLKSILEVIDDSPVLNRKMLLLTKELSDYYCCSWGEAIETAIPSALRKGKKLSLGTVPERVGGRNLSANHLLIHDLDGLGRWEIYLKEIKETLKDNKSAIVLLPDINFVLKAQETINVNLGILPAVLYRRKAAELAEWLKVKEGKTNVVIGTRSSIFAPLDNLGLIIIDEEQEGVYKQEQVPHYHAREVAFMRSNIEKAKLILGSSAPSLEAFFNPLVKHIFIPRKKPLAQIKIIDTSSLRYRRGGKDILSAYLQDAISAVLAAGGKTLLFLNRRGFATFCSCRHCRIILKCPRCNVNLVYHFKKGILNCHYCNFKMPPLDICPHCNSGYIRYSGLGTEKIESELSRIFPHAKVERLDGQKEIDFKATDIFVAAQSIAKRRDYNFDLIGILGIDNSLNRIDFRAAEKTNALLTVLAGLTDKELVIQTGLAAHYCFGALTEKDINLFYDAELKERKQLKFPPFSHLGLVKLRSKEEAQVKQRAENLFKELKRRGKNKGIQVVSVNPARPSKLRGKFWWQILLKADSAYKISQFLKINLKKFSHSGIIVTVDIDPV